MAAADSSRVQAGGAAEERVPTVLGIGGTLRLGSSSELALRAALAGAERAGARTRIVAGAALDLPSYAPERGHRTEAAAELVELIRTADGIILSSPGYHGGPSGMIKNALDYVEDLREVDPPYLDGRAVGCIATAYGWQATVTTLVALRSVVHSLRGWPTPLGVAVRSSDAVFSEHGEVLDAALAVQLETMAHQVVEFARTRVAVAR
jgi:FMN reductase